MDIAKRDFLAAGLGLGVGLAAAGKAAAQGRGRDRFVPVNSNVQPSSVDPNYKPRRINKAIELWEDGQPIYYLGSGLGPGVDSYAQGVKMARTWMDAINVEMEHGVLDVWQLREFMRGLRDGGPTRSGHATPAVFVETAIIGLDESYMRANSWVIEQLLDSGIHGIHMCHARNTKAIQVATQMACRYPFNRKGVPKLEMQGLRGSSAGFAAQVWGQTLAQYVHKADLWPFNPNGELIFGVKIEDTYCDADVASTLALPGIAMAEWGPGDHSYWLYDIDDIFPLDGPPPRNLQDRPEMRKVRQRVLDLCKQHNIRFLNAANPDQSSSDYVITQIKDGAMVLEATEQSAIIGREYTKRKMPV